MAIHKYLDWKNWLFGLYKSAMTAIGTAGATMLSSNAADSMGITKALGVDHIGLTWKQALFQLGVHVALATFLYIKAQPVPETVTENIDTQQIKKP
jgi:hypothetical protein